MKSKTLLSFILLSLIAHNLPAMDNPVPDEELFILDNQSVIQQRLMNAGFSEFAARTLLYTTLADRQMTFREIADEVLSAYNGCADRAQNTEEPKKITLAILNADPAVVVQLPDADVLLQRLQKIRPYGFGEKTRIYQELDNQQMALDQIINIVNTHLDKYYIACKGKKGNLARLLAQDSKKIACNIIIPVLIQDSPAALHTFKAMRLINETNR